VTVYLFLCRQKDARTREYFEKIFPEIKKSREVQERFARYAAITVKNLCCGTGEILICLSCVLYWAVNLLHRS